MAGKLAVVGTVALWGNLRPPMGGELCGDYGYVLSLDELVDRRPHRKHDPWEPLPHDPRKQRSERVCLAHSPWEKSVLGELRTTYGIAGRPWREVEAA